MAFVENHDTDRFLGEGKDTLMCDLDATEDQLDFTVVYGSAKNGWMSDDYNKPTDNIDYLLDKIVEKRIDGFFSCTEVAAKRKMDSRKDCVKDALQ